MMGDEGEGRCMRRNIENQLVQSGETARYIKYNVSTITRAWHHDDEEGEGGRRHVVSFPRGLSVFPDRGDNHKVVVVVVPSHGSFSFHQQAQTLLARITPEA